MEMELLYLSLKARYNKVSMSLNSSAELFVDFMVSEKILFLSWVNGSKWHPGCGQFGP